MLNFYQNKLRNIESRWVLLSDYINEV